mgnify:CR=1 FL=1
MARYRGPIVDAHHHLWRDAAATIPWLRAPGNASLAADCGPAELRAAAGRLDIVASVWIEALAADPIAEAVAAAAVHAADPRVATAIVAHAPLDAPDIGDRLDRLREAVPTLRGIRDIVAVRPGQASFARAPDLLSRPAFAEGLRALATRGLVFDLMLEPWQMPEALALARAIPELTVIIEHAGSPDFSTEEGAALWGAAMRAASRVPNVAVKISALHCRMPGWTDQRLQAPILELVDWFGAGRLAFASDFPVHDRTVPFARAYETFARAVEGLTAAEQAALFHDTARRLYRI